MKHRLIEGRLSYTSRKPEKYGQVRGFETFMFTRHGDGKVTMRAHCEIDEPEPIVMRDIIYSIDEHNQPMDLHVRLTVGDAFMGSGWMRFDGTTIECESYSPSLGRVSQRVVADLPIDGFGTHPIVSDGYALSTKSWTVGQKCKFNMYLPSPDHRGATPPLIAQVKIDAIYLGTETVTVTAGTFATRHFQFIDDGSAGMAGEHPVYDLWITDDEDAIFVQGGVGGYMMTWYELVELKR
ncbi:MAG: hypothetical protein ACOYLK_07950 [Sphingomonas sp.]|jgi:hypothetical protein